MTKKQSAANVTSVSGTGKTKQHENSTTNEPPNYLTWPEDTTWMVVRSVVLDGHDLGTLYYCHPPGRWIFETSSAELRDLEEVVWSTECHARENIKIWAQVSGLVPGKVHSKRQVPA